MANQIHDERMRENLEMIAKLRLMDDDLMRMVFDNNVEATALLLNIVLEKNDLTVLEVISQREYKNPNVGGRTITIDVYVNGAYKNDEEPIGRLMHDFRCTSAVDMYYPPLADSMRFFKETDGGRERMCKAFEELAEKRALEERKEFARRMLIDGKNSLEDVSKYTGLPIEEVESIKASLQVV